TPAFAAAIWLSTRDRARTFQFALAHGALGAGLLILTFGLPRGAAALVCNSMSTGLFHATFFSLAYLVGRKIGGDRAAVWAAGLEGTLGYIGFILSRMI